MKTKLRALVSTRQCSYPTTTLKPAEIKESQGSRVLTIIDPMPLHEEIGASKYWMYRVSFVEDAACISVSAVRQPCFALSRWLETHNEYEIASKTSQKQLLCAQ